MSTVVVSWFLTLLAVFGLVYAHDVVGESRLVAGEIERHQLRAWARSGVEMVRVVLEDTTSIAAEAVDAATALDALAAPRVCGRGTFAVGHRDQDAGRAVWEFGPRDEGSRLPLALADSASLSALKGLSNAGVKALLETKRRLGPQPCPPFRLLDGLNGSDLTAVEMNLTRYGSTVNINTASADVLEALGVPTGAVNKILLHRAGGDRIPGTEDDRPFVGIDGNAPDVIACGMNNQEAAAFAYVVDTGRLATTSTHFSLVSRGWGGGLHGVCELAVVIERTESGATRIVEWSERWLN